MKKVLLILISLLMLLSLAACVPVSLPAYARTDAASRVRASVSTRAVTAEPTPAPTAEPTPEPTPTPAPTEVPFEVILAEANEKLDRVNSLRTDIRLDMEMKMTISMEGTDESEPIYMSLTGFMDVVRDPYLARMNMTLSVMGIYVDYVIYAIRDGDVQVFYVSLDNGVTWKRQADPRKTALLIPHSDSLYQFSSENACRIQRTGTTTVNGKAAAVYSGTLEGKYLQDVLEKTLTEEKNLDDDDEALLKTALSNTEDIQVTFMIDEESGLPVRYVIDMTDAVQSFVKALAAADPDMDEVDLQVDVSTVKMDCTLSRFDSIEPIVIPEEALAAPEA